MRRFGMMCSVLLIIALVANAVPASAAKKHEGQTLQVLIGITPLAREQIMEHIAPKLKEKWGVDLAVEPMGSTQIIEKIVVMKDNPRISIAGWDVPIGLAAAEMGLCETIDPVKLPSLKLLYDWAISRYNGEIKVLAANLTGIGLVYNEDELKAKKIAPPVSWQDLWKPEYKGRVSITAPESTWGLAFLVTMARLEGGGEKTIDPGFAKIKTLTANVHTIHTWSSELVKLMQLGEVWFATTGSNMGPSMREKGFPATWVFPKEGAPMANGGMSIVKGSPLQEVAYDFLDMYYGTAFQLIRAKNSGITSPNKDVWAQLSDKDKQSQPIPAESFGKLMELDWAIIAKEKAGWIERWHKEIK
jgi:putative spermidine/putrescine transport system substrate-binding protein